MTIDYKDNAQCAINEWKGCCCNCENHCELMGHPWHTVDKGMDDSIGVYVCNVFANEDGKSIISGKHGYCEMWSKRK